MTIRRIPLTIALLAALGAVVLTLQPVQAASAPSPAGITHEVLPGDCLHLIAGYYYGDARLWERIWQANKATIKNPNVLERGSVLVIPSAAVPPEPYPDFSARTKGCGPAGTAAGKVEGQSAAGTASPASRAPSKTR